MTSNTISTTTARMNFFAFVEEGNMFLRKGAIRVEK